MAEVAKLQGFLNVELALKLPPNGSFGPLTEAAVKKFQLKYKEEILVPVGITKPTGLVMAGTRGQINKLVCAL